MAKRIFVSAKGLSTNEQLAKILPKSRHTLENYRKSVAEKIRKRVESFLSRCSNPGWAEYRTFLVEELRAADRMLVKKRTDVGPKNAEAALMFESARSRTRWPQS